MDNALFIWITGNHKLIYEIIFDAMEDNANIDVSMVFSVATSNTSLIPWPLDTDKRSIIYEEAHWSQIQYPFPRTPLLFAQYPGKASTV